jgi:hypothetical protein
MLVGGSRETEDGRSGSYPYLPFNVYQKDRGTRGMVKLLMSWDIRPGQESEYFEFIVREFAPGIMRLGIQPTEAWYTVYGDGPQILTGGVAEDLQTMQQILAGDEWKELQDKLMGYVTDYRQKIVAATGRFQLM